jgi:prolyl-tRNA synthetase
LSYCSNVVEIILFGLLLFLVMLGMFRGRVKHLSLSLLPVLLETPAGVSSASHRVLLQSGAIKQLHSGVFSWLPYGHSLLSRIAGVIDEEMERAAFEKCSLASLQPRSLWEASNRWDALGQEMFRLQDRKSGDYVLAPTAEEAFVNAVGEHPRLPVKLYQLGLKWRDEARPRAGALRAREFVMKDGYSMHSDDKCLANTYEQVCASYERVLTRLTGGTERWCKARGDTGAMGGSVSHEWHMFSEEGEDEVRSCPKCRQLHNAELQPCCGGDASKVKHRNKQTKATIFFSFFCREEQFARWAIRFNLVGATLPIRWGATVLACRVCSRLSLLLGRPGRRKSQRKQEQCFSSAFFSQINADMGLL